MCDEPPLTLDELRQIRFLLSEKAALTHVAIVTCISPAGVETIQWVVGPVNEAKAAKIVECWMARPNHYARAFPLSPVDGTSSGS